MNFNYTDINELNNVRDLNQLDRFVDQLEAKDIGFFGGRKFKLKNEEAQGELSLNEVLQKFLELKDQISDDPNLASKLKEKIQNLDQKSNELLKKKNFFTQFLTSMRSDLGSNIVINVNPNPRFERYKSFSKDQTFKKIEEIVNHNKKKAEELAREVLEIIKPYFDKINNKIDAKREIDEEYEKLEKELELERSLNKKLDEYKSTNGSLVGKETLLTFLKDELFEKINKERQQQILKLFESNHYKLY